ncbi:hypothetical protein POM88_051289 [Heracleum sosnowskyi]|uniref:Uncharacterized protein n=1 Tax=Heracleum sosnowskyi TaxID=360622 RepID=A0AAD8H1M7_9APIA|nr:hypothetical protein POM88_051289 [Heracleum sosnowskyi]
MMDDKSSERMHGFWFGSMDTFKYEVVTCVKCLRRPSQMVRDNKYLESETPLLNGLQFRKPLASIQDILRIVPGSYFWLSRPNQSLPAVTHSAIVNCACPVFSAAASNLCAKHQKVKVNKIELRSDSNSASTCTNNLCFDHFGISKEKIDPRKVKWNREHRPVVQLGWGRILGAFGATYVCPLQNTCLNILMQTPDIYSTYFHQRELPQI